MAIHVLSSETIDQIAAGEVVERPSSVVKELVENAIDAGSTSIKVQIKEGGIEYIRVTDNGCGIDAGELRTAFMRHATSKIATAADLAYVQSLGFRGEALSSIAAVSKLEVITKTTDHLTGTRMIMEGASETSFEEIGAPDGTTMMVRNLFFNTPVRRKFLKSATTEAGYITELMEHLALSRPDISFEYQIGSQTRFFTTGSGDLKDVVYRIYGREIANGLIPISVSENGFSLEGYLGKPQLVRSNRNFEIYYINDRFVRSNLIARAIEEGYREYLMQHKFPLCILRIGVTPGEVDVNVHPTKLEVRLSNGKVFYDFLSQQIHEVLQHKEMIPGQILEDARELRKESVQLQKSINAVHMPEPFEKRRIEPISGFQSGKAPDQQEQAKQGMPSSATSQMREKVDAKPISEEDLFFEDLPAETPVNAVASKVAEEIAYSPTKLETAEAVKSDFPESNVQIVQPVSMEPITSPTSDDFVFADNTSATAPEKIEEEAMLPNSPMQQMNLFEDKLLSRDKRANYKIIGQLFDTYWIVQYENKMFMIDQHAAHEKVNYERLMRRVREKTVLSQAIYPPVIVSLSGKEEIVLETHLSAFTNLGFEIENFGGNEYAIRGVPMDLFGNQIRELFLAVLDELAEGNSRGSYQAIEEKVASMSCKAAIKGGDRIDTLEAEALIDELLTLDNPYNCPHGRPTIIVMSKQELEKKFKRIVD